MRNNVAAAAFGNGTVVVRLSARRARADFRGLAGWLCPLAPTGRGAVRPTVRGACADESETADSWLLPGVPIPLMGPNRMWT